MTRSVLAFVAALSLAGALNAQNPTIASEVRQSYARTKDLILRAASKMPDEAYSLKPAAEVRTFAQVIGHISEAQASICGGIASIPTRVDTTKTAKADVIVELTKSFSVCDRAYDLLNDSNLGQVGGAGFMGGTMVGRLYGNLIHDNEMYGTMVVYMRIKGIVPPSSEPRSGR